MTSLLPDSRRPDMSVCFSGRIDITSRVARMLNLHPGDVIDICHSGSEYYLYVRISASEAVGRHEGQCYPTSNSAAGGTFRVWSARLARAILDASGSGNRKLRFPCGLPVIINNKTYIPAIIHCSL